MFVLSLPASNSALSRPPRPLIRAHFPASSGAGRDVGATRPAAVTSSDLLDHTSAHRGRRSLRPACMKHEGRSSQGAPLQVKPASLIKHEATHFSPECVSEAAAVCSLKQQQMVVGFARLLKRMFRTLFQFNLLGRKQRSGVNIVRPFSPVTMIQGVLVENEK